MPRPSGDDQDALVARAQAGDSAAWAALYGRFRKVVHGIVVARAGLTDADDLVQDVFATVASKLSTLRQADAFAGWICQIARRRATDELRRRMRRPAHEPLSPGTEPASRACSGSELQRRVLEHVRSLPEAYREPLVLRLVEGLSGPEIADRTGLTPGSVRVNLSRGMAQLRPLLAKDGWP